MFSEDTSVGGGAVGAGSALLSVALDGTSGITYGKLNIMKLKCSLAWKVTHLSRRLPSCASLESLQN